MEINIEIFTKFSEGEPCFEVHNHKLSIPDLMRLIERDIKWFPPKELNLGNKRVVHSINLESIRIY